MKSPGWEDEIVKTEGRNSPRLQTKHVDMDARATAPWASVRHAVAKAYPKMPTTMATMLVINDDLITPLADWGDWVTDIALYCPRSPGHTSGYLAEDGPFVDHRYARLGAVAIFQVDMPAQRPRYRFALFENPHALPPVVVPYAFGAGYPRYDGSGRVA